MDVTAMTGGVNAGSERSAIEEKYPRIAQALCELWGHESYAPYLSSLVFDNRGNRQGFPPDVSMELFMLYNLLDYQPTGDMWTESNHRL